MNDQFSYPVFVRSLFKQDVLPMMYIHAAMGISGEVAEAFEAAMRSTDPAELAEELGDIMFYTQAMLNFYHDDISRHFHADVLPVTNIPEMVVEAGNILDLVKKYVMYNTPLKVNELHETLIRFAEHLYSVILDFGYTPAQIMELNFKKLMKRYPSGEYKDADAAARADKITNAVPDEV